MNVQSLVWKNLLWFLLFASVAGVGQNIHRDMHRQQKDLTQFSHEVWQTEDGLPQNSISTITQTRDGYLWLGTLEGLVRFDGVRFTVFDVGNTPALPSNRIVSLFEDKSGSLWIGTEDGGVTKLSHGKFTTFTKNEGLLSNTIGNICEDSRGTIWIAHGNGITLLKDGEFRTLTHEDGLPGKTVSAVCSDAEGSVWIGTEKGLVRWRFDEFELFPKTHFPPGADIFCLRAGTQGTLWIGTTEGLSRFKNGKFTSWTKHDGLIHEFVWSLCEGQNGKLFIGTHGGGLCEFDGNRFIPFTSKNGLSSDLVWSIFEDREGLLWIGTNGGGLNRLKNALLTAYTSLHGLVYDFVWSICESPSGDLWLGTYKGLTKYDGKVFTSYTTRDGLSDNFIWSVYVDSRKRVWVGTTNGLDMFENGKFINYTMKDGLAGSTIRCILEDSDKRLWVGTARGLSKGLTTLNEDKRQRFTTITKESGLLNDVVMSLCEGNDGSMWIGTNGGLTRYKNGNYISYTTMEGLSDDVIRSLYQDKEGNLWIGTQGGGLNLFRDGKFKQITQRHGLFNNVVSQILEDDEGDLWMSCNKGIYRVAKSELLDFANEKIRKVNCIAYGKDEGMKSPECNGSSQPAGWKARDGRLWFPTIKGVVVVNPKEVEINSIISPVIVEQVLVNKKPISELNPTGIPVGSGELEVEYTGLSFYAPEKVLFKYKLDGYDKKWKEAGTRRTAFYTNLSPGTYTFWVTASGEDTTQLGPSTSFSFTLLPNFYQETWFYGLCLISVVGLSYSVFRLRLRRMKIREQKLLELVKERTKNLQDEKEKAEHARHLEEQQRKLAEEANLIKSEILHIAAHDMKSPLVSIKMFSQVIANESERESATAQFSDDIHHNAERLLELINELLEASAIESPKFKLQLTRVDFSKVAQTVLLNNQKMAERKEQTLHFESDGICVVEADEGRIRQVMDNLVNNAIKYSPNGKPIRIKAYCVNDSVRFEVNDEGPGFTETDKKRVFGKFQRLSARPTGGEPSTGLGLSIVKQLVEMQGGNVKLESETEKGSTFIMEFPCSKKSSGVFMNEILSRQD
jgi:ligand-binding sensor domain-containing protein/signal transduction histidine kinase